ncbi:MAG: PAS domain S-box protein [Anaerolineae bacterium]
MSTQIRILYMEDNEGIARLLQKKLMRAGYEIDITPSGEEGLSLCAERAYDAVIVDYHMPGMSGIQVIQQLAAREMMPPTIMLTGTGNERIAVEALKLGAFDYVIKDIDGVYLDLLPTVIEQALENQQLLIDKRRAEKALHDSEERFRSVVEQSLDGIMLIDQTGKIIEWNHAEAYITGIPRDAALGQYVWDLTYQMLPPENQQAMPFTAYKAMFDELLHTRKSSWLDHVFEYEIIRAEGVRRTLQVSRFLIDLGDRFLVSEIARDITERKQMELALRESEERFRMLFEEAPDPYFVTDMAGNLIDCNWAVEPLVGLKKSEMIGKNFVDVGLFDPVQIANIAEVLARLPHGELARPPEIAITRPDGRNLIVDMRVIPIQDKGETQILGIGHDITWRKQAEAQMKTHIEQLVTLSRIDDDLTRRLDIHYVQAMALDSMIELSGASAGSIAVIDEAGGIDIQSVGYPEGLNTHYSLEKGSITARVAQRREAEWVKDVTTDPDYFAVRPDTRSQISIPFVSQERFIGIVSLETHQPESFTADLFEFLKLVATRIAVAIDNAQLYDVSQKQLLELQDLYEQLRTLEQLKTDMVRIVSHDLRNPLTIITTSTALLERSLGKTIAENQQRYMTQINQSIDRMKALVTDVLSLESIERLARGEVSSRKIDLLELIYELIDAARAQAERKNLAFSFSPPDVPVVVKGSSTERCSRRFPIWWTTPSNTHPTVAACMLPCAIARAWRALK